MAEIHYRNYLSLPGRRATLMPIPAGLENEEEEEAATPRDLSSLAALSSQSC